MLKKFEYAIKRARRRCSGEVINQDRLAWIWVHSSKMVENENGLT